MKAIVFLEPRWAVVELESVEYRSHKVKWWWGGAHGWMRYADGAETYATASEAVDAMNKAHHTEPHTSYQHAVSTQPMHGLRTPPQSGWSCPRCTRIYGPTVQICVPCNTRVAQKENA